MSHGDDKGLVLPPKVAPIQVVFVPIHYKESDKENILHTVRRLANELEKHSIRTFVDDGEQYTPGWKYHEWEMKGVPLRVEIGPRDMSSKQITIVRRDSGKKIPIPQSEATSQIVNTLNEIQLSLLQKSKETLHKLSTTATDMKQLAEIIDTKGGFVKAFLSENNDCEDKIKQETGATVRIVPFEPSKKGGCVYCGAANSKEVVFARSY